MKTFTCGEVILRHQYDGKEIVEYHPWKSEGVVLKVGEVDLDKTLYSVPELRESYPTFDHAVIGIMVQKNLGLNNSNLVYAIGRMLTLKGRRWKERKMNVQDRAKRTHAAFEWFASNEQKTPEEDFYAGFEVALKHRDEKIAQLKADAAKMAEVVLNVADYLTGFEDVATIANKYQESAVSKQHGQKITIYGEFDDDGNVFECFEGPAPIHITLTESDDTWLQFDNCAGKTFRLFVKQEEQKP